MPPVTDATTTQILALSDRWRALTFRLRTEVGLVLGYLYCTVHVWEPSSGASSQVLVFLACLDTRQKQRIERCAAALWDGAATATTVGKFNVKKQITLLLDRSQKDDPASVGLLPVPHNKLGKNTAWRLTNTDALLLWPRPGHHQWHGAHAEVSYKRYRRGGPVCHVSERDQTHRLAHLQDRQIDPCVRNAPSIEKRGGATR